MYSNLEGNNKIIFRKVPNLFANNPQIKQKIPVSQLQIKKENKKSAYFDFMLSFLSTSTIHGLVYLSDYKKHPVEIIIWLAFVIAGMYGSIAISMTTWTRYQENPTVISMERDRYNWNTSFPSATICPDFKINEALLDEYVETSKEENKTLLRDFLVSLSEATYKTFHKVVPYDKISSDQYMQLMLDLQFEFEPSVSNSGANGYQYILQKVVTETGICYSFNSKLAIYNSPMYWSIGKWNLLPGNATFYVHPLDGEVFANVVNMSTGFNIYIHGPFEVADCSSKNIFSANGYFLQVYLTALTLFSSQRARELRVGQRKCRFHDESNLDHSPVYSYRLCRMECRIRLAKQYCGCMPHFYRNTKKDKICDVQGLHCLAQYAEELVTLKKKCSCLPNCDEVNFVIEDLDTREWFLGSNLQWGLKEYPRMRLKRDVLFGFSDLLVYVGGMAGLFLGCSVLSFIEIIYFFTIRLFWFTIRYGRETKVLQK